MSGFEGLKANLSFDQGIVRIVRGKSNPEVLMELEKRAIKHRVLDVRLQKSTFRYFGYVALVVDLNETNFEIMNYLKCPPNLVLTNRPKQQEAAEPVVAEILAALESGQEVFYVNLDPSNSTAPQIEANDDSEAPAPQVENDKVSPEWEELAGEIRETITSTPTDGFFVIGVGTAEQYELYLQGSWTSPNKIWIEIPLPTEGPNFTEETKAALINAGWKPPGTNESPNYTKEVAWSSHEAGAVANFLTNTLQWCVFLDPATVTLHPQIFEES